MVACSKIVLLATGAAALVAPPALQARQATALAASLAAAAAVLR